jgi:hypothetical protein
VPALRELGLAAVLVAVPVVAFVAKVRDAVVGGAGADGAIVVATGGIIGHLGLAAICISTVTMRVTEPAEAMVTARVIVRISAPDKAIYGVSTEPLVSEKRDLRLGMFATVSGGVRLPS